MPSRLDEDFKVLDRVGSGTFGVVLRAQHRVDDAIYAIKKVAVPGWCDETQQQRILREVMMLSELSHRNIVRYYSAWMEEGSAKDVDPLSLVHDADAGAGSSGGTSSCSGPIAGASASLSSGVMSQIGDVCALAPTPANSDIDVWQSGSRSGSSSSGVDAAAIGECLHFVPKLTPLPVPRHRTMYLHIQMEYCASTLKAYLMHLNKMEPSSRSEPALGSVRKDRAKDRARHGVTDQSESQRWDWFGQLMAAVAFLHARKIVHRDIKPANILLSSAGHAKLGDLGLARRVAVPLDSPLDSCPDCMEGFELEPDHQVAGQQLFHPERTVSPARLARDQQHGERKEHARERETVAQVPQKVPLIDSGTDGVGTPFYVPPGFKARDLGSCFAADVYACGIVLFEMFEPLHSEMERCKVLERLRERCFPPGHEARQPRQHALLRYMLMLGDGGTPTARNVLQLVPMQAAASAEADVDLGLGTEREDPDMSSDLHVWSWTHYKQMQEKDQELVRARQLHLCMRRQLADTRRLLASTQKELAAEREEVARLRRRIARSASRSEPGSGSASALGSVLATRRRAASSL